MDSVNDIMHYCLKCNSQIKLRQIIDGKERNFGNRKYCLKCSPFGTRNTKKIHIEKKAEKKIHSRNYSSLTHNEKKSLNKKTYKYQKYRRNLRKIELLKYKGKLECSKCRYNKCIHSLCFHHKNPLEKEFELNARNMYAKSLDILKKEADKCIVLCLNCHSELHFGTHDEN